MRPRQLSLSLAVALALPLAACQKAGSPEPPAAPAAAVAPAATPAPVFAHVEDFDAGMAKAKAEGKAVLVDAWAPWCHTCLSMQNYVLNDPSLASLGARVVLVELDTDKPENAGFLEKYSVNVWPTFFVIDPNSGKATGLWPGSASASEFRGFVEDGLAGIEAANSAADPESPPQLMVSAKAAQASGDYAQAAKHYEQAVAKAEAGWPRRNEALAGWLFSLAQAGDDAKCVTVGRAHLAEVTGAAVPADYAGTLLGCAGDGSAGPEAKAAHAEAVARLREFTASPPADASADDRADAWNLLSGALADEGDEAGAMKAQAERLAVLEKAAAGIKDPLLAQTFDYQRAQAYVMLKRGDEAVQMLEAREKELPESYEPPARLASALAKMERLPEALVAIDRAIAKSYGPRQLLYVKQKADIQARMGDHAGQIATLQQEVAGYEKLAKGHARPEALEDAKKRLAEARQHRGA
jgi:tetratricopeptide (TPR) repeat protein